MHVAAALHCICGHYQNRVPQLELSSHVIAASPAYPADEVATGAEAIPQAPRKRARAASSEPLPTQGGSAAGPSSGGGSAGAEEPQAQPATKAKAARPRASRKTKAAGPAAASDAAASEASPGSGEGLDAPGASRKRASRSSKAKKSTAASEAAIDAATAAGEGQATPKATTKRAPRVGSKGSKRAGLPAAADGPGQQQQVHAFPEAQVTGLSVASGSSFDAPDLLQDPRATAQTAARATSSINLPERASVSSTSSGAATQTVDGTPSTEVPSGGSSGRPRARSKPLAQTLADVLGFRGRPIRPILAEAQAEAENHVRLATSGLRRWGKHGKQGSTSGTQYLLSLLEEGCVPWTNTARKLMDLELEEAWLVWKAWRDYCGKVQAGRGIRAGGVGNAWAARSCEGGACARWTSTRARRGPKLGCRLQGPVLLCAADWAVFMRAQVAASSPTPSMTDT